MDVVTLALIDRIFFVVVIIAAAIYHFRCVKKLKKRIGELTDELAVRHEHLDKVIDGVIGVYVKSMDIIAMHGSVPHLLARELESSLFRCPDAKDALLGSISHLADYRFNGVITRIRATYPELNRRDLDICALACFKVPSLVMMKIYGYQTQAAYYNRRRAIVRRMNLASPSDSWAFEDKMAEFIASCPGVEK